MMLMTYDASLMPCQRKSLSNNLGFGIPNDRFDGQAAVVQSIIHAPHRFSSIVPPRTVWCSWYWSMFL